MKTTVLVMEFADGSQAAVASDSASDLDGAVADLRKSRSYGKKAVEKAVVIRQNGSSAVVVKRLTCGADARRDAMAKAAKKQAEKDAEKRE